jgi:hypothetical protein
VIRIFGENISEKRGKYRNGPKEIAAVPLKF